MTKRALRHCAICDYVFVYSSDRVFRHPDWLGHLICETCGVANNVAPIAVGESALRKQEE